MKNLAKIFFAVSVALFSFACATDMTEDLGVKVGGYTVLSVSTPDADEATKTAIGGKTDNGYKLVWSEGDQISVNGIVSDPLTEGGNGNASFEFEGVLDTPFNVLYPGNADGQVTFPAVQNYLDGTFDAGSAPMYGYSADGNSIQMSHLAGVVRLAVYGKGVLNSIVLTPAEGNLAGTYTVDFTEETRGALTAVEGTTSSTVTLSFGEGLAVDTTAEAPVEFFIALPAGEYGKVTIDLVAETGTMKKSFNTAGEKNIVAGTVRVMPTFKLGVGGAGEIVIDGEDKLMEFAENADDYTKATVAADLDMSGVEWTPINGFAGEFNGGNFTISGLKAPLFGTTNATSIKNVKLNAAISDYVAGQYFGALACNLTNTEAAVEDCSVSGTITLVGESGNSSYHAALIGLSESNNEFKNLSSSVALTISTTYKTGFVYIGGVMAKHSGALTNATHTGNITFNGKQDKSGNTEIAGVCHYVVGDVTNCVNGDVNNKHNAGNIFVENAEVIAGHYSMIAGVVYKAESATISDCYNYGDLTVADAGKSYKGVRLSGIFDHSETLGLAVTNCENHGNLTASATLTEAVNCYGGITANKLSTASYTNAHNYGDITLTADHSANTNTYIGGIHAGLVFNSNYTLNFDNCSNNGKLTFLGTHTSTNSKYLVLGGLVSCVQAANAVNMTDCHNNGEIIIGGTTSGIIRAGGVFGDVRKLTANNVGNNAKISCTTAFTYSGAASHGIGGFVGFLYGFDLGTAEGENYYNYGDIDVSGATFTKSDTFYVGGAVAYADEAKGDCVNKATVYCDINTGSNTLKTGMVLGVPASVNVAVNNCSLGGTINGNTLDKNNYYQYIASNVDAYTKKSVLAEKNDIAYISAVNAEKQYPDQDPEVVVPDMIATPDDFVAFATALKAGSTDKEVTVTANLDLSGVSTDLYPINNFEGTFDGGNFEISGLKAPLFGETAATAIRNVKLVEVAIDNYAAGQYFGALACNITNEAAVVEDCSVSGTIKLAGSTTTSCFHASLIGYSASTVEFKNLTSSANIEFAGTSYGGTLYLAGVVATHKGALNSAVNTGTLTFSGNQGGNLLEIAGVAGWIDGVGKMTNCVNGSAESDQDGAIKIEGNIESGDTVMAGVVRNFRGSEMDGCYNYGSLTLNRKDKTHLALRASGLFDTCADGATIKNSENYGLISIAAETTGTSYFGGIVANKAGGEEGVVFNNVHNHGQISLTNDFVNSGDNHVHVAGFNATRLNGSNVTHTLTNCSNTGVITTAGNCGIKNLYVGGLFSRISDINSVTMTDCWNNGEFNIGGRAYKIYVGGIVGAMAKKVVAKNVGNWAKLHFNGTTIDESTGNAGSGTCYGIAGFAGYSTAAIGTDTGESVFNYGEISVDGATIPNAKTHCRIAGIAGYTSAHVKNASVYCTVTSGALTKGMIIGVGTSSSIKIDNCSVGGKLNATDISSSNCKAYTNGALKATSYVTNISHLTAAPTTYEPWLAEINAKYTVTE